MSVRRRLRFVLCDIDDTLTTDGELVASAYLALSKLTRAGFSVVPVTGRPAGWCDMIARQWPVSAVVGENGAFYFRYDAAHRKVIRRYWRGEAQRRDDQAALRILAARVLDEVPGAGVASDQEFRNTDLAIDWCEDVPRLSDAALDRIVEIARTAGATVKVSSIHVNIWFGEYDKLQMSRRLFQDEFDTDADTLRDAGIFVGDSPNDAQMFEYFPYAVGVANVLEFLERMTVAPTYVARKAGGDGFAEVGRALLAARRSQT